MKPDLVIAFPGGHGTADMVRRAKVAGVVVLEPEAREGAGDDPKPDPLDGFRPDLSR